MAPEGAPATAATLPIPDLMFSELSERILLGVVFNEDRRVLAGTLVGLLAPEDFHFPQHVDAWRCVAQLNELGVPHDAGAVLDRARSLNLFLGGVEYVTGILEDPAVLAGVSDEAALKTGARVKAFATRRRLREALLRGLALCDTSELPVEDIVGSIEDDMYNLRKISETSETGPAHISTILDSVFERMQKQMDGEVAPPTPTGFYDVDNLISGLEDESLVVLAARPSMGKTALLNNFAGNGAHNKRPALIFSLEMAKEALGTRMLATESEVNVTDIKKATIQEHDWEKLTSGMSKLAGLPIYIDSSPGLTMHEIRSRARAFVAKHGKCTVYVDYLQIIAESDRGIGKAPQERKDVTSGISLGLKRLAREIKCPVVALSQLNRALEQRANKRPIMSDLRESGQIEQDADVIMFIYRDEVYNPDTKEPGVAEVIVAKQRDGATGTVKLGFDKPRSRFYNLSGFPDD